MFKYIIVFTVLSVFIPGPLSGAQKMRFVIDGNFIIGCYSESEKKFLEAERCQELVNIGDQMEVLNGKITSNDIYIVAKKAIDRGPPCNDVLYFDVDSDVMNKIGTKDYRVSLLKPGHGEYREQIVTWLKKQYPFLKRALTDIPQIVKGDINNDGRDEVLFSVNTLRINRPLAGEWRPVWIHLSPPEYRDRFKGRKYFYYSGIGIRYIDKHGNVATSALMDDKFAETTPPPIDRDTGERITDHVQSLYELAGFTDLDNDGVLELIVRGSYYEGSGSMLLSIDKDNPDKTQLISENGCGV